MIAGIETFCPVGIPPPELKGAIGGGRLLEVFVGCEILCQLAQLTSSLSALRLVWRIAPFALSFALLVMLPGRRRLHPAATAAMWVFAILGLSLLNPSNDSLMAAGAQLVMYIAIIGPVFWASRLHLRLNTMRRVLLLMWGFQTLSASIGVLQVCFPGHFQPNISAIILSGGEFGVQSLKYRNDVGVMVFRPMGLTDVPGGAATAGFYAALFGMALFMTERRLWRRALFAASMPIGSACIYLCQVRATLLMLIASVVAFAGIVALRNLNAHDTRYSGVAGRPRARLSLAPLTAAIVAAGLLGFSIAVSLGGKAVVDRFSTLSPQNASETYRHSRGQFLSHTMTELLPEYPLGAGLGRWGMMNYYFGDKSNPEKPLWAEIQWTGWLFDGGLPLIIAYVIALAIAFRTAYRMTMNATVLEIAFFGALVFSFGISALALTFDYPFFMSQAGMDFWLLNSMLFGVARALPIPRRIAAE